MNKCPKTRQPDKATTEICPCQDSSPANRYDRPPLFEQSQAPPERSQEPLLCNRLGLLRRHQSLGRCQAPEPARSRLDEADAARGLHGMPNELVNRQVQYAASASYSTFAPD